MEKEKEVEEEEEKVTMMMKMDKKEKILEKMIKVRFQRTRLSMKCKGTLKRSLKKSSLSGASQMTNLTNKTRLISTSTPSNLALLIQFSISSKGRSRSIRIHITVAIRKKIRRQMGRHLRLRSLPNKKC